MSEAREDIVPRLKDWIANKWPRDRTLDHDLLDALREIEELRETVQKLRKNISHMDWLPGYPKP